jgi:HAD superfamily 5'-nucleotidase-like hydrolase
VNPVQLSLPIDEFLARPQAPGIPRHRRIFCNRNLRMSAIAWVGFDMDYTLAIYNQREMDELSIRATIAKLVERGYPKFVATVAQYPSFPVRGILIDKRFGHILKMNRYKFVTKGYHGLRELAKEDLRQLYHSKKIRPATPRYHWIDTLYALSEAAIYAALVDAMEQRGLAVDFAKMFTDIRESIDEAHRDGTILEAVASDFPRFVHKDPELAPTLHKLRSAGKRLFLLTNSRWSYTDKMMTYLIGDAMGEYPHWRNYFDVVICAAMKPAFFQERRPLMEQSGGELVPAAFPLERGKIYEGGNLQDLERALGVVGDEVLYVGDHIYGDILRSKKESAWRTAMIIQELEGEVLAHDSCHEDFERCEQLEVARDRLEDELRFYHGRFKELTRRGEHGHFKSNGHPHPSSSPPSVNGRGHDSDAERSLVKRAIERVRGRLRLVDGELTVIERRIDQRFHTFWGSLLKEENEQSCFGSQVEDYACLYTSRVSNFLLYSPQQYFRSPRDEMAHEQA